MTQRLCPECGDDQLIIEKTILEDELFEEISCPRCGYYDSNIQCLVAEKPNPDIEFKF